MSAHFQLIPACAGVSLLLAACSTESLQRLAYGAVQSAGQQRCLDNSPSSHSIRCLDQVSYDEYQRERREVASTH
jgi:hypothetical protein